MAAEDNESTAQGAVQPARSWEGVGDRLEVRLVGDGPSAWPLVTVLSTKGRTSAGINSFVGQFVSRVASRHEEQVTAASMHALDRLGRTASSRALEPSPTREMYLSLGDLDADGSGEVVVTTSSADSGRPVTHTVMDAELDVRWAAGADQGARLLRAPDDAGRSRVALVHPGLIEMRQGADGTRIWTSETRAVAGRSLRGEFEASIYHLTTDPSADGQGSDWHLRLDPIDLRTGLAAGTGPTIELGSFGGADAPGSFTGFDVDGDGKLDLVSQGQGSDGMGGPLLFVRRTGDVARGPVTTDAQPLAGLQLDATPGQEVVWLGWSEAREQWDEVFASRPGQRMWLVPLNRWERMVPLSVDGITHFAEVTVAQDGTPIARLLDGGTLEPRWTQSLD